MSISIAQIDRGGSWGVGKQLGEVMWKVEDTKGMWWRRLAPIGPIGLWEVPPLNVRVFTFSLSVNLQT